MFKDGVAVSSTFACFATARIVGSRSAEDMVVSCFRRHWQDH